MDRQTDNGMNSLLKNNNTLNGDSSISNYDIASPLHFWLFLIFDVCAILCTVFVLYNLLAKRILRKAVHNHALILMLLFDLVYEFIDIPLHLQYFITGIVQPITPGLCLLWWFIDWCFYYTMALLVLFTSIERHILIFHSHMLATHRKRLLFHYFPLLLIILLTTSFYSIALFAPICENTFDYTSDLCGAYACYTSIPFFIIFEQLGFSAIPAFLTAGFNILLLVRVIRQNYRMRRSIQWRKQRKLAFQVILMSLVFLVFEFPLTIVYLVRLWGDPNWGANVLPSFFFLSYFSVFFLPFVCLASLPTLSNLIPKRRQQRIAPIIVQ